MTLYRRPNNSAELNNRKTELRKIFSPGSYEKWRRTIVPRWQKSLKKHVCGKVHVVMPVDTVGHPSVQPTELFELAGNCILKRISQSGVVQKARDTIRAQIFSNLLVMSSQSSWNCCVRKTGR